MLLPLFLYEVYPSPQISLLLYFYLVFLFNLKKKSGSFNGDERQDGVFSLQIYGQSEKLNMSLTFIIYIGQTVERHHN